MTAYDEVPLAEHEDRMARVLSVPCSYCGEPAGRVCTGPDGDTQGQQHAARWDAWYAAHPEAGTS